MTRGTKRLFLGTAAAVVVSLGFLVEERVRGVMALNRWQAEMRAKGERLTLAEIAPPPPTNSACLVLSPQEAASRLASVASSFDPPPAMRYVAAGKAQALWQTGSWKPERQRTNSWAQSSRAIERAMPAIEQVRADLTNQAFVVRLDYDQGFTMMLPHLAAYKGAAVTLKTATQLALREHRLDLATEDLVAMAALADLSKSEGLLINELVRDAIAAIGVGVLWEALQAEGWSDAQLAAVQIAWQKPEFMRGMARAFEVERGVGSLVYDRRRYSFGELCELQNGWIASSVPSGNGADQSGWFGELLRPVVESGIRFRYLVGLFIWRVAWVEQDQLRHQQVLQQAMDRMRRAASEKRFWREPRRADQETPLSEDTQPSVAATWGRMRYWLSGSMLPSLQRAPDKAVAVEAQRDLAVTALAIKRYQLRHAKAPDRLEALVPEFLPAVPPDWFAAAPLHYRSEPGGSFLLYSVGPDGEDNGGDATPSVVGAEPSFARGRDLVWPQPAAAGEIVAFESALR